jgi:uncharacterized phage protein (TIGR02218 family)
MAWKDAVDVQTPTVVELYEFKYEDGTYERFTSHSRSIVWGGNNYIAIPISRDAQEQEATIKVGTLRVTIDLGDYTRSLIDVTKIRNQRILDRGEFFLYQVGLNDPANNWRLRFNGFTGIVRINRLTLEIEFRDIFFLLKKNLPANIYGESCNLQFGSPVCSVDLSTIKVVGAAGAGSTSILLLDASRTEADGFFDRGYITYTTGALAGEQSTVKRYTLVGGVGTFDLMPPLSGAPTPGDQYEAFPHCQKVYDGCLTYANTDNFFGFQHIPRPEQF